MKEDQSTRNAAGEQALITRLQALPIPIRILRHERGGGFWYQWSTMVAGTGDCGSFADALIEALTYIQDHSVQEQHPVRQLQGAGSRDTRKDILSLRAALRHLHLRQRRVKATEAMYLLVGGQAGQEWITGELALEMVFNARHSGPIFADWDGYIETGLGPDAPGIYVFLGNRAYRAFDLELEPTTANSMQAQIAMHLWMLTRRDFAPDTSDTEARHRSTIALLEQREDVAQSALLALMSECLEIYEDNPREDGAF